MLEAYDEGWCAHWDQVVEDTPPAYPQNSQNVLI